MPSVFPSRGRFPRIFSFFLLAVLLLCGCAWPGGKSHTADDLAFRLLNLYPSLPPCSQYIKNGEPYSPGYLSPEDFSYLYTGEKVRLPEWDRIEEFRIILSDSTEFFEIHVLKTVTASDADEVGKLLSRRAEMLKIYGKENVGFPIKEPLLFQKDRFVLLIATCDNEAAARLLDRLL